MPRSRLGALALVVVMIVLALLLPVAGASAQIPATYQVWYFAPNDSDPLSHVEYRDASGTVVASYTLTTDAFNWPHHGGGILYGFGEQMVPVFDPAAGQIVFQRLEGWQPATDEYWYNLTQIVPHPSSPIFAYGIMQQPSDWEQPATNWIYVSTPGQPSAQLIHTATTESYWAVTPLDWASDGSTLLIQDMPQGIGGYILFWQHVNVRALDMSTGAVRPLGDLDGYAPDLQQVAMIEHDDAGMVRGLTVKVVASGAEVFYPLPNLGENAPLGGDATFAPDNSKVAFQVARASMENEKYWTILIDLLTSEARVVLEDEATNYEVRYANIGGWLDSNTLVVGDTWSGHSAVIDAASGTFLYEAPGTFLGLAPNITGFAPSGVVYAACPGAPVSRLMPQMRGRITVTDGSSSNVRSWPGLDSEKTMTLPEGTTFTVSSGPTCADGYAWWALDFDDGTYGYVAEGDLQDYYLEPWLNN